MSRKIKIILFVCKGNAARSIIAECIINNIYKNRFKAFSAGSYPDGVINVNIKKYLENRKFNLDQYYSKNFDKFISDQTEIDYIISVCKSAHNSIYPVLPKNKEITHWDIEKPIQQFRKTKSDEEINLIIEKMYITINKKIENWIKNH
tara:strand:- start:124 stop:567 length:444 start_codon:yes stop_codon:yes gene_type:complete